MDALFATDLAMDSSGLKTEANYIQFAKQVSGILYEGKTPYNIPAFFAELFRELSKS